MTNFLQFNYHKNKIRRFRNYSTQSIERIWFDHLWYNSRQSSLEFIIEYVHFFKTGFSMLFILCPLPAHHCPPTSIHKQSQMLIILGSHWRPLWSLTPIKRWILFGKEEPIIVAGCPEGIFSRSVHRNNTTGKGGKEYFIVRMLVFLNKGQCCK